MQILSKPARGAALAPEPLQRDADPAPAPPQSRATPAPARRQRRADPADGQPETLTGPQARVLDALAWLSDLGITDRASRVQVAFLAGYKPGGGSFNNTLGQLRGTGLIEYPSSGEVALTERGRRLAQDPDIPHTDEALQRAVMSKLTGPQRRVLQPLIDCYPLDMDVHDLADNSGYEAGGGAFNNTRGSLRSLGLIDYPTPGRAVALPVLFVEEAA